MEELKSKTVLIFDRGLFVHLAERLSRDFGRVMYYSPWKTAFPKSSSAMIGRGIDGVERVDEFFDHVHEADLIVFPDVGDADLQSHLRAAGKRVWGSFAAEKMETDRWEFRKLQQKLQMSVPESRKIVGVEKLREHLKSVEDKYVKISKFRGDLESFHHYNYNVSEPYLDDLEARLGAKKTEAQFIVESPAGDIETGYDGWCIDGQFPEIACYGYEIKDLAYFGKIGPYKSFPQSLVTINEKLSGSLKESGMRGFFSTEVRVSKNRKSYLIDPCMRMGSPPGEVMVEAFSNFSDIVWEGAAGNLVKPKPTGSYMGIALAHSIFADTRWMSVDIPAGVRQWVKMKNETSIGGKTYSVPTHAELYTVAAVCAVGNSPKEVFDAIEDRAKQIKAYDIVVKTDALRNAQDVVVEGRKYGINF